MKKKCLKDAIVDMVFKIADLPSMNAPTRALKEKIKKLFLKTAKSFRGRSFSGRYFLWKNIRSGDRDRLIQIMQFVDTPYAIEEQPGTSLLSSISQYLAKPKTFIRPKLSFKNDVNALFSFINEKELSLCSRNREKCLNFVQNKLHSMYNATLAKRYYLDDFMPDDGWMLQIIRQVIYALATRKPKKYWFSTLSHHSWRRKKTLFCIKAY